MKSKTSKTSSVRPSELIRGTHSRKRRLGQWLATAICGNDITSSCLYVAAIASVYAGVLAPIVLLLVGGVLYLYKKVYTEVVEALPLNGGAYNCLLNATSRFTASLAACMTILSYIATAVISAKTAVEYLHHLIPDFPVIPHHHRNSCAFCLIDHYRDYGIRAGGSHHFSFSHGYVGLFLPVGVCKYSRAPRHREGQSYDHASWRRSCDRLVFRVFRGTSGGQRI